MYIRTMTGREACEAVVVWVLTRLLMGFLSLKWWHTILAGGDVSMSNQGHSSFIMIRRSHASALQSMKSMYFANRWCARIEESSSGWGPLSLKLSFSVVASCIVSS